MTRWSSGETDEARIDRVRSLIAAYMPDVRIESILLGQGLGNVAYEVNDQLVVRFSTDPDLDAPRRSGWEGIRPSRSCSSFFTTAYPPTEVLRSRGRLPGLPQTPRDTPAGHSKRAATGPEKGHRSHTR
jgi:hypothetical protein